MGTRECTISKAWLEEPASGCILLTSDWLGKQLPPVRLLPKAVKFLTLLKRCPARYAWVAGFYSNRKDHITFAVPLERFPELKTPGTEVFVVGDFNGWQNAVGNKQWLLQPGQLDGADVLLLSTPAEGLFTDPPQRFKFVTAEHRWLGVNSSAPNAARDELGNYNHTLEPARTGHHWLEFSLAEPIDLAEDWQVAWQDEPVVSLQPGDFFHALKSELPLGAIVRGNETIFRLFAPRAKLVALYLCAKLDEQPVAHVYQLHRREDYVWEVILDGNLHGWYYWYQIEGSFANGAPGFDKNHRVLDPYAQASVDRLGPGIVLDPQWVGRGDTAFRTPAWHDIVMVEAHVRDLAEKAPVRLTPAERRGFTGLRKWIESPDFYLHHLGVNAVELQPIQEFDNRTPEEYHWGYMTVNFFSPESSYALDAEHASGVKEFQELVAAFHRRGMAVILDVVYNHVGEPAHLMFIDRAYYFEVDTHGELSNWSGCGNDVRARSAMAKRLIIDSLRHLVEVYGVDGFRFDLADLIGTDVLREIEIALKRVKPDVVLIAEPWSFRGHIAAELRDTGYSSWNDGYRNFLRDYVRGGGTPDGFAYFLKGSPGNYAKWPAQTVNYTESHDDRTWIDNITENPDGNGHHPTANDRRRTHLMAAVLFSSIGIPMISAGQDFLRSKKGVNNTYQRGDLNALDYRRIYRFPASHAYFAAWIAFRRSEAGRFLRQFSRPAETFFHFYFCPNSTAVAVVYNADLSQGPQRLLFAVNPTVDDITIPISSELAAESWHQLADHEHFFDTSRHEHPQPVESELFVPALGCGLWLTPTP